MRAICASHLHHWAWHGTGGVKALPPLIRRAVGRHQFDTWGVIEVEMQPVEERRGHYLGTEIDGKWWRRYSSDGLLARGIGEFRIDASALFFRRYLTQIPIVISFNDVLDVKLGKWHSGRWAGGAPVVKILWKKGDKLFSSGFVFSRDARDTDLLVQEIRSHMQDARTLPEAVSAGAKSRVAE